MDELALVTLFVLVAVVTGTLAVALPVTVADVAASKGVLPSFTKDWARKMWQILATSLRLHQAWRREASRSIRANNPTYLTNSQLCRFKRFSPGQI